jgi:hypothetical protein
MKPILFAAKRRGLLLLAAAVAILAVAAVAAASSDPPLPPDIDTTQVDQGVFGPGPAGTPIEGTEAEVTVKAVKKAKKDKPDKPGSVTASEADSSAQIIYVCTYGTYAISEAFGIMRSGLHAELPEPQHRRSDRRGRLHARVRRRNRLIRLDGAELQPPLRLQLLLLLHELQQRGGGLDVQEGRLLPPPAVRVLPVRRGRQQPCHCHGRASPLRLSHRPG